MHEVIHDAFAAAHEKAPGIAEPIIDKAVADKKITEAQADRIREMMKCGPPAAGRHGPHGPGFGGPPPFADEDVRAVLEDIHAAVAKQAPDIVGPVIDKAEQDGKITAAQADRLRDAAGEPGRRQAARRPPRMLDLRDEDVREVLHDAFEALAAKTPGIAKPIIDKAVEDKKITEAQADQLRDMQRRFKGGLHGPATAPARARSPAAGSAGLRAPASAAGPAEQHRLGAFLRHTSAAPAPCLRGRARRTESECMKKLSLVVAPVRTRHSRRLIREGRRRPQVRCQALQGHARRDGRRGLPCRLRQAERQARDEALCRRAEEGQQGRQAAREEGLQGRGQARAGAEALRARQARGRASLRRTRGATRRRSSECKAAQEEDPEGFAEEYGDGADALEQCVAAQTEDEDPTRRSPNRDEDDPVEEEPGDGRDRRTSRTPESV